MNQSIILVWVLVVAQAFAATEQITTITPVETQSASEDLTSRSFNLEENKIESKSHKRNPKFGFNIPFPMPGVGGDPNATGNPDNQIFGDPGSASTALGTTAVLIKGGILSGLLALKAAILPPLFLGALILFLIAGAGFFTCSIVNCGRIFGENIGPSFGQPPSFNPFNRNGLDDFDHRPVFHAIDDSYKKFETQY